MSLFNSSIRPPAPLSDEAVARHVAAIRAGIEPDQLFRRRLRGHVLNQYVAAREGIGQGRLAKEMTRLGRAVLYASFALGISVTGVMAASQQAIPGDLFYPLKLQIEDLRYHAVPGHLHDELATYQLGERIAELDRLAAGGDGPAVARQAGAVEAAYAVVLEVGGDVTDLAEGLEVAAALVDRLPDQARAIVQRMLAGTPGVGPGGNPGNPGNPVSGRDPVADPPGQSRGRDWDEPPGRSRGGGPADPGDSDPSAPTPAPTPAPTETPDATKTPKPMPTTTPKVQPTKPPQAADPSHPPQSQPSKAPNPGSAGGP